MAAEEEVRRRTSTRLAILKDELLRLVLAGPPARADIFDQFGIKAPEEHRRRIRNLKEEIEILEKYVENDLTVVGRGRSHKKRQIDDRMGFAELVMEKSGRKNIASWTRRLFEQCAFPPEWNWTVAKAYNYVKTYKNLTEPRGDKNGQE